jgi:hypothetical protein
MDLTSEKSQQQWYQLIHNGIHSTQKTENNQNRSPLRMSETFFIELPIIEKVATRSQVTEKQIG